MLSNDEFLKKIENGSELSDDDLSAVAGGEINFPDSFTSIFAALPFSDFLGGRINNPDNIIE